ncbi:hypothetical protein JK2ML_2178 [Mycobacterium leprae Kyoto-2]|uniref:VapC45 PIN like domain-containing protein n=3 Tax=Mycobacterium leprae TaxID=1769 RepID=Q9CBD0_MYCLE|nr:hypothetical protein [Mycobacterium leprae]CAR72275.1 hypothetical protein MLBr02178 [Mycobacterium leprae Br4923]AWV48510.1 hypothetical protein DIJ64_11920 [Mycobacterium leprae]OAR19989.1 hypothetical protein A8144_03260 [Mycobacterium leprae 3125609]OAX70933.1 hypothetical protein A3216_08860 [Mycobacterium leprae 7935681]CAC31133.1 hypothetical protein [Mycobacterium leprae]
MSWEKFASDGKRHSGGPPLHCTYCARHLIDALLPKIPKSIDDSDWIIDVGERGWVVITNYKRIRISSIEVQMLIEHHLKVVHL